MIVVLCWLALSSAARAGGLVVDGAHSIDGAPGESYTGFANALCVGDLNGDGDRDLVVGANGHAAMGGWVYIFEGSAAGVRGTDTRAAALTLEGTDATIELGRAVACAGDLNGDGYDDLAVSAGDNVGSGNMPSRVHLYFGSLSGIIGSSEADADVTLKSEATDDAFGFALASDGDINGDGVDDLVVGASWADGKAGRVDLFLGGADGITASGPSEADAVLYGEADSSFGEDVASGADVNADGYDDLLVGAPGDDGHAYLYLGAAGGISASAADEADAVLEGEADSRFGGSVAPAGDTNGDGYDDVGVGAAYYDSYAGRAYVFLGGEDGVGSRAAVDADTLLTGLNIAENNWFGTSVASAGDVNGDGFDDVAVSPRIGMYPQTTLFLGASGGIASASAPDADVVVESDLYAGGLVTWGGDLNGDGYDDLVTGSQTSEYQGVAYVFHGGAAGVTATHVADADTAISGDVGQSRFGMAMAAGDLDGDGYRDLALGAPFLSNWNGRVYVAYFGTPAGAGLIWAEDADAQYTAPCALCRLGAALSAGDLNGDGYDDLAINAYLGTIAAANVYVLLGSGDGLPDVYIDDADTAIIDTDARTLNAEADVNGDGTNDLIVGAPEERVYLLHGGATGIAATTYADADSTIATSAGLLTFGTSVASGGDLNGDGYDDVVVGVPLSGEVGSGVGAATVFLGASGGIAATSAVDADNLVVDTTGGKSLGTSLTGLSDLDGDGFDELVIGAPEENRVYLFHGSAAGIAATGTTDADQTLLGEVDGDLFGASVARAGDPSADGTPDLLVGAPGFDGGAGRAYFFSGAAGGLSTTSAGSADETFDAVAADDALGSVVLGTGDLNGDLNDDLALSAPYSNDDQGRVDIHLICGGQPYTDSDGDGYGGAEAGTTCDPPDGAVTRSGDCDDLNPDIAPDQTEICDDGIDNNCDLLIDAADADCAETEDSGLDSGPPAPAGDSAADLPLETDKGAGSGCGCAGAPDRAGLSVLALALGALARRRRA